MRATELVPTWGLCCSLRAGTHLPCPGGFAAGSLRGMVVVRGRQGSNKTRPSEISHLARENAWRKTCAEAAAPRGPVRPGGFDAVLSAWPRSGRSCCPSVCTGPAAASGPRSLWWPLTGVLGFVPEMTACLCPEGDNGVRLCNFPQTPNSSLLTRLLR